MSTQLKTVLKPTYQESLPVLAGILKRMYIAPYLSFLHGTKHLNRVSYLRTILQLHISNITYIQVYIFFALLGLAIGEINHFEICLS